MMLIDSLSADYQQGELLRLFEVHRSSYTYYRKNKDRVDPERERLKAKVVSIYEKSRGAAGSRTIAGQLRQQGETIGRHKVRSLMKEADIRSKQPGEHRYKVATKPSDIAPNHLNRQFEVEAMNRVWCGDVTYIWCGTHWLYLALVIDLFKRRIVGWALSDSPDSQLTKQALMVAYYSRGCPEGLMFHSDQGCHYTSEAYRRSLSAYNIKQSMSRRGNCWDNAPMERCFRSFKTEWMPETGYNDSQQVEPDVMRFIHYYNNDRGHSYNDYMPPSVAESQDDYKEVA